MITAAIRMYVCVIPPCNHSWKKERKKCFLNEKKTVHTGTTRTPGTEEERRQANRILPLVSRHHFLLVTLLLFNSLANEVGVLVAGFTWWAARG